MNKREVKAYKVVVDSKKSRSTLLCVTYKIGLSGSEKGAEFYELVSSFDNTSIVIPQGSHTYTF